VTLAAVLPLDLMPAPIATIAEATTAKGNQFGSSVFFATSLSVHCSVWLKTDLFAVDATDYAS
jgi:hypothetical protein